MQVYGIPALVRVISHFSFIYLTFWSLQSIRTDQFFKKTNLIQIRMVYLLISIGIGYLVSSFLLECMDLIRNFFITMPK